jgi:hypothetical protein
MFKLSLVSYTLDLSLAAVMVERLSAGSDRAVGMMMATVPYITPAPPCYKGIFVV